MGSENLFRRVKGNLRFPLTFTYHGCPRNSHETPTKLHETPPRKFGSVSEKQSLVTKMTVKATDGYIIWVTVPSGMEGLREHW